MSWIGVGLVAGGTALSAGGNMLGQYGALKNASSEASAANSVLASNILTQQGYQNKNNNALQTDLDNYQPATQSADLATAQGARGAADAANITPTNAGSVPLSPGAPAAVSNAYAQRGAAANTFATNEATADGNLGGYGDTWLQNSLGDQSAGRTIGVNNDLSGIEQSLLSPEQQLAETQAYQSPSIWGPLLTGAGGIMASAGGSKLGGTAPAAPAPAAPAMTGPSVWNTATAYMNPTGQQ